MMTFELVKILNKSSNVFKIDFFAQFAANKGFKVEYESWVFQLTHAMDKRYEICIEATAAL